MGDTSDYYTVKKETVDWVVMLLTAIIPQPFISFIVMKLLHEGWSVFWYTILAINTFQLVMWLTNTLVTTIMFRLYSRRRLSDMVYNELVRLKFPTGDYPGLNVADVYYHEIACDSDIPCNIRMKAAAFYNEMKTTNSGIIASMRLQKVHDEAIIKYFKNHPGITISSYYDEEDFSIVN
jgi:hypothetical protein